MVALLCDVEGQGMGEGFIVWTSRALYKSLSRL